MVSLSAEKKVIPYSDLLQELDLKNIRELEDLVIESLYQGLIKGKLDQKWKHLEVDFAIGRDLRPGQLDEMTAILVDWCNKSEIMIATIKERMMLAAALEDNKKQHKTDLQQRIKNVKENLKVMEMETPPLSISPLDYMDDDNIMMKKKEGKGCTEKRKGTLF